LKLIRAAAREVKDPKSGQKRLSTMAGSRPRTTGRTRSGIRSAHRPARSGSDYTPFLQHLGVPSTDMGFGGDYGVYHSDFRLVLLDDAFRRSGFCSLTWAAAKLWGSDGDPAGRMLMVSLSTTQTMRINREYFDESIRLARHRHLDSAIDEKSINDAVKSFSEEAMRLEKRDRN